MKESALIPTGWKLVASGRAYGGDKHWDSKLGVWLPITVNQFTNVEDYAAVIRKDEK